MFCCTKCGCMPTTSWLHWTPSNELFSRCLRGGKMLIKGRGKQHQSLFTLQNVLSELEAMLAWKFSEDEANNCILQQCKCQLSTTVPITNSKNYTSQVPSVINDVNQSTNISNITNRSNPPCTAGMISKPKVKCLWITALQTWQHRSKFDAVQKHFNNATNHKTKWYTAEKERKAQGKKGMSAEEVCN